MPDLPRVAMAWYSREQFNDALCVMEDAPNEPISYDDWLIGAEKQKKALEQRGHNIERIEINGVEFSEYCMNHGIKRDSSARSKFAMWKLACKIEGAIVDEKK